MLRSSLRPSKKAQGEATAGRTDEEYARQPHNSNKIRNGNYDEMAVLPLDYERICAGDPGEFAVVVGADHPLFMSAHTEACSLSSALQADGAELGTLYRTQTGVRVEYGPAPAGGGLTEEIFDIYADGQQEPDDGAWTLIESLRFGVVVITAPTAPTPVGTSATNQTNRELPSPTTAPAAAAAPVDPNQRKSEVRVFFLSRCSWVVPRLLNSDAKGGIKKEPNAQVLCRKNIDFFRRTHHRRSRR